MDTRKSITNGLNNAVSNLIYGTNPLGSVKEAFGRGFGAGAATSAINYISDLIGQKPVGSGVREELLSGVAGAAVSPFALMRDPRRGCGSASPFTPSIGYSTAKGYRYDTPQTANQSQSQRRGFSLKAFLGETLLGGLTGGFTSAAFYGAGKGIEALKTSASVRNVDVDQALSLKFESGDAKKRKALEEAMRISGPSNDKVFKVFAHGDPDGMMFRNVKLDAEKVAYIIQNSPKYVGGKQVVILYSCETGKNPNGFAKELADILGVTVFAPNAEIRPVKTGGFLIGNIYKEGGGYNIDRGRFIPFIPES